MLEHEDEIKARPPRTWFQTEKQKRELAKASKEAAANGACRVAFQGLAGCSQQGWSVVAELWGFRVAASRGGAWF